MRTIDGRRSSAAASPVFLVIALVCVPALLRATQQLGHGPKIRQVCGLSTSASRPPDPVAPSVAAVVVRVVTGAPPPERGRFVSVPVALPQSALVPFQSSPRAPPSVL